MTWQETRSMKWGWCDDGAKEKAIGMAEGIALGEMGRCNRDCAGDRGGGDGVWVSGDIGDAGFAAVSGAGENDRCRGVSAASECDGGRRAGGGAGFGPER
jgi:hypothetical protein